VHSPDRTLTSRYECKYLVSPDALPGIRMLARPFMRPDRFALNFEGYRYSLSSLYLDSPGLELFQTTLDGHRNRYKLRVRTYNDAPDSRVFFEIKRRADQVVLKSRAGTSREVAKRILCGTPAGEPITPDLRKFCLSMREISAEPVLRVRYEREAYESIGGDPVRLTFDTRIQHLVTRTPDLAIHTNGWRDTPIEGVVVEIKFSESCPSWVSSMIDRLEMVRESIPKYVTSLEAALRQTRALPSMTRIQQLDSLAAAQLRSSGLAGEDRVKHG
jgi:VTC domain